VHNRQTLAGILASLGLAVAGLGGPEWACAAGAEATPAAVVGGQLAAQEKQLRTTLAQTAAVVVRSDGALELWYPVRLAFVPDGTDLLPGCATLLDLLARSLREYGHSQVVVAVYTDAIGSSEFNQGQSQARATVLVEALQARGVDAARLVARGMGEAAQLEAPDTAEGRDLNRRVQFVITPLSS
jgi:outer membrane protein OmpA-like peptidoglycan-associated protein